MFGYFKKNNNFFNTFDQGGFTLMEMIVVVAIFIIITMIVLVNAPQFREKTSLELVAQEIAINIRGAQVYGVATRKVDEDYPSFGIHIDASTQDFFLFPVYSDQNIFLGQTAVEQYVLPDGYVFSRLEAPGVDANVADIVFRRPRPEAEIYVDENDSNQLSSLSIFIKSTRSSQEKEILILKNGNISIEF